MIASLRRAHRLVFVVLAVLVPVLLALALAVRRPMPRVGTLPPELTLGAGASEAGDDAAETDAEAAGAAAD